MTDRQLPQAVNAEQAIIGTCFVQPEAIHDIMSILTPEMFYLESNKQLYTAIIDVTKKNGNSDLISITDYLRIKDQLDNFGGVIGLTKRTENIVSDRYLKDYALLVREKYILRQYIIAGFQLVDHAYSETLDQVIEYSETTLFNISNITQSKEPKHISRLVDEYLAEIEKIINKEKRLSGVPSGFTTIDRITGGWQPSDLIIVAGRPSMGKTAVALSLAKGSAEYNFPVAIFSLEMSESQLTGRYLSGVSNRTNMEMRSGHVNLQDLSIKSNEIARLPIYIDDTPAIGLFELRSKIKKLIVRCGVKIAIIDYLQLMKAEAGSREQEVSQISRGLKSIAKEFDIPIIALSQLNRSVEERIDKKPRLSDLRESGAIEQDADIVAFINRPAYYKMQTTTINGDEVSTAGLMIFDFAKNRNGACVTLPLYHNEALTKIEDVKPELVNAPY